MSAVIPFHAGGAALAAKAQGDNRVAPRRRMLKAGIIAYNGRYATLPCMVRDMSATGARLRLSGSVGAPDTFELIIELDGLEANCEVVWRRDQDVGVRFVSAPRRVAPKRTQVINALTPAQAPSLRRKPIT
ncbi:MAG: PilZ domain-containing protein [Hyphomicrobiaceae bacterium]|nr:MAG: PilZ domain-containing protein [Hyphomicrobiaceae bacterium]